ncbi:alpha/beta hydrolase [Luteibacter sp. Lutesp34]|uniref:alpha/beta hydrolase n=1 Tax=Luteibacter sp. Lutesp34 TaxID=3243030 RepID=UPI0039B3A7FC
MRILRLAAHVACLPLFATALSPAHASVNNVTAAAPRIAWRPCPDAWTGPTSANLGNRLKCGSMSAPLDHEAPDGNVLEIGVIRVSAAVPALREGTIFFHAGGPGAPPGTLMQSIARAWTDSDVPYKRRLAERFDFVAVIPRGLVGSGELRCVTGMPPSYAPLPGDLGDANWNLMLSEAQTIADACSAPSHARYINTEQHVHDMDMLRRALGEQRIHFYGISHGSLVGAWYASVYPQHTGRMLWDSGFNVTRDYTAALQSAIVAQHEALVRNALTPIRLDPARYGFGSNPGIVTEAIDKLRVLMRKVRLSAMEKPVELAAALHFANLWEVHKPATLDAMLRLLRHPLAPDPNMDARLRQLANTLAEWVYTPASTTPRFQSGPEADSVRIVVPCNDMPSMRSEDAIRQAAREDSRRYLSMTGREVVDEIICLRWGPPTARPMVQSNIDQAPTFLMLQSEADTSTPLAGAMDMLDRFANARMLLVRNSKEHGLFNFTRSPCIERTVARYLATGQLPETGSRVFACDGTLGNPLEGIPGEPAPPFVEPVAMTLPPASPPPVSHDEL